MLHANDYFDNAEIASDRPIYRAGGNLQNFVHTMQVRLSQYGQNGFLHFSKYIFLCSAEVLEVWNNMNDNRMFIFVRTIHLIIQLFNICH